MKRNEPGKAFDCVEMKRRAQERIYERIKGLSPEEEIAYFRRAVETGPLADWWEAVSSQQTAATVKPPRRSTRVGGRRGRSRGRS